MQVYYIGETSNLRYRARNHGGRPGGWPVTNPWISYWIQPQETPKYMLRELESDLCGWHFWQTGGAPCKQYSRDKDESG